MHSVPPLNFEHGDAFELMETCEAVAGECETYRTFMAEDGDVAAVEALQLRRRVARGLAETVADKATAQCLDRANEHQDEETGYVGYVADRFDGSREWCAVWANYVKNPRKKTIDFPESAGAFAAELPKQVLSAAVAMRARRTAVDAHSELCANELMAVTGAGILAVDLLSLPPLSKTTKGWTVKPRSPLTDAIERVRYPIPRPDDDDDDASTAATPAVRISHAIPANLALVDPRPRVAWWDELNQTWTEDGVSDVDVDVVDADTRRLSFSTIVLERFALVQSRVAMFPYRSWHVRPAPMGSNAGASDSSRNVIVSVETNCPALAQTPVELEVGDGWARLANADDLPAPTFVALREMRDVRLPPKALLAELSRRGVHLTPEDRDARYLAVGAGSNEGSNEDGSNEDGSNEDGSNEYGEQTGAGMAMKDLANERAACEDVGIIAPGYFVHSTRWCARPPFGTKDSVVRVAEVRDVHLTDAVDVRKIFTNEHDPREWRPDRYDWGMKTLLRNERGCAFVDVKDSYVTLDDSLEVIVRDGRGERVGAKAVRARMIEGTRDGGAIPAPTYYPDARSALISLGSRRGGRERVDDASFTATATTAETLRLLRVFSFTREREPEPEVSEPEPEVSEPELERERTSPEPEPEPELDEDGNPVEKPSRGDEDGDVDPDAEAAEERANDLV